MGAGLVSSVLLLLQLLILSSPSCLAQDTTDGGSIDLQTQIYIITGVYGGILLLLILLALALALSIAKLKDQISRDMDRYSPEPIRKPGSTNQQIYAYENGAYNNGAADPERSGGGGGGGMQERSVDGADDLERMGYTVYSGNRNNRPGAPTGGSKPVMKYEEAVIPLEVRGDRRSAPHPRDRYA